MTRFVSIFGNSLVALVFEGSRWREKRVLKKTNLVSFAFLYVHVAFVPACFLFTFVAFSIQAKRLL